MAASHFLVGAKSEAFRTRNVRKSSGTCEDWSRDRSHKLIGIEWAIISTLHFAILPKTSLVIGQFENGDFFCFSLLSTRKRRFREPETTFFFRTSGSRLRLDGRKRRLLNTVMSYILLSLRMPCFKGMLSYFHRFSFFIWKGKNDSNTLPLDACVFENGDFFLRSQKYVDTCGNHGHKRNRLVFTIYSKLCAFQITAPSLLLLNSSL